MKKIIFLTCLLLAVVLYGGDEKLKVNKPDSTSQLYEITNISNITFTDPGIYKLKIIRPGGTFQLFSLSEISNLFLSEASEIEKTEFFKKLGIGLVGNYPNPFNPITTINFSTTNTGAAKVEVFNQIGQLVTTLHDGNLTAGSHTMQWNAQGNSAGTYFIRVSQNGETVSNKMLLLK